MTDRASYRPDVDGLRAIAVTSVVLFHASIFPFSSGFVGVDIFFVISGYLIGGIILREAGAGAFSYLRFYARRVRRILPALAALILAMCVAGWFLLPPGSFKDVGLTGALALVGASNINFWQFQDYFAPDTHSRTLLMTWSLGVEEQFYLVFPILILATMRFARSHLIAILGALCVASFALSLWWTRVSPVSAFYLLPARAWELGIGALLAAMELGHVASLRKGLGLPERTQHLLAVAGLLALVVAVTCFNDHTPFPGTMALLPTLGAAALIASPKSWVNRHLLSAPPMTFVGLVSYSWYLWHWPLMSLYGNIIAHKPMSFELGTIAAVSFGIAVLSWRFVEQPFRRGPLAPKPVLIRYAGALVVIAAIPLFIAFSGGVTWRLTPKANAIETAANELTHDKCLMVGSTVSTNPKCRSRPAGRDVVVLFGDSHAWVFGAPIKRLAEAQGLGWEIMTKAACTPVLGVEVRHPAFHDLAATCKAYKAEAIAKIVADPHVKTVVLGGYWFPPVTLSPSRGFVVGEGATPETSGLTLLHDGLTRTLAALVGAHKQVVLLQDVPIYDFDVLKIGFSANMPVRNAVAKSFDSDVARLESGRTPAVGVDRHADVVKTIADVAAQFPGVRVVDPFSTFCQRGECTFSHDGAPLYIDDSHLSPPGAAMVLGDMRLTLDPPADSALEAVHIP